MKNSKLTRRESRELDVKISFLEGLTRRDPHYVEALQMLGDHYSQRGNVPCSLLVDKRLSGLEPHNPLVFYNLACSHSLSGEIQAAAEAMKKALALGYNDFKWLARDPDLVALREHPIFREIEAKILRMKIQVTSNQ